MSHLRDIQKLRHTRNPPPHCETWLRFTPPNQPETYHIALNRLDPSKTCTNKFNDSKEKVSLSRELKSAKKSSCSGPPLS
jgi:hypothetical protein